MLNIVGDKTITSLRKTTSPGESQSTHDWLSQISSNFMPVLTQWLVLKTMDHWWRSFMVPLRIMRKVEMMPKWWFEASAILTCSTLYIEKSFTTSTSSVNAKMQPKSRHLPEYHLNLPEIKLSKGHLLSKFAQKSAKWHCKVGKSRAVRGTHKDLMVECVQWTMTWRVVKMHWDSLISMDYSVHFNYKSFSHANYLLELVQNHEIHVTFSGDLPIWDLRQVFFQAMYFTKNLTWQVR